MSEPIPQEVLDKEHRALLRRIAAVIADAMALSDVSFAVAAVIVGRTEEELKRWYMDLLDGTGGELREASDMATAMGGRILLGLQPNSPWDRASKEEPEENKSSPSSLPLNTDQT